MLKQKPMKKQKMQKRSVVSGFGLLLMLVLTSFSVNQTIAQDRITGIVKDVGGIPIPGVNIRQLGVKNGTVTDFNGNYSLFLKPGKKTLEFSYLGFEKQVVSVGSNTTINITLDDAAQGLDEVVVIGYTSVKRDKILGAVSTVKAESIESASPVGVLDGVQGKIAGVQILTNGGPGSGFDIRVRGVSTFGGAGTSPLYVVDGQQLDDIDNLNPNDIASLEVLKDGATAAIYGAKAANGVVLITTKSAKSGELKFDISSVTGMNQLVGDLRVANSRQRIEYEKLRQNNTSALTSQERDSLSLINRNSYDLQKLVTRVAIRQQTNVAVSGGSKNTKFYINSGFLDEKGVVINSDYKRFNTLLKVDVDVSKKFKFGSKLNATFEEQNGLSESAVFSQLVARIPYYPLYEPNGDFTAEFAGRANPLAESTRTLKTRNYRGQMFNYASLQLLPHLTVKSTLGINYRETKFNDFSPIITVNPNNPIPVGRLRQTTTYDIQQENFLNYKNSWGDHDFQSFAGMQTQQYTRENMDQRANFLSDEVETFNNIDPLTLSVLDATNSKNSTYSLFAGFNYDYQNKYLVGATIRRDGSSRFGANNKFGNFPSATVGWKISNEKFLKGNNTVSKLMLRASYGIVGNERISNYDFTGSYEPGSIYDGVNGIAVGRLGNPDLKWEETASTNLGIDLGMFRNKLNLAVDLWEKKTTDLLASVPLPEETSFSSIRKNVGAINNRGIDISLSGTVIKSKDFKWDSSFNISYQENKVTKLDGGTPFQSGAYLIQEGHSIGEIYGYKNLGIYQYNESNAYTPEGVRLTPNFNPAGAFVNYSLNGASYSGTINQMKNSGAVLQGGDIIWEDLNGDFDVNAADRQVIGNGLAKYFGGFSNDFRYKNFKLSLLFDYNFGNDLYRRWDELRNDLNSSGETPGPDRIDGAWRKPGDITEYPRLTRVVQNRLAPNSYFVTSGDYIKLRYVRLNYDLPKKFISSIKGLSSVSLNLAVNNVLTWTKYIGYNPELGNRGNPLTPGTDDLRYPNDREVIIGLKVQFN